MSDVNKIKYSIPETQQKSVEKEQATSNGKDWTYLELNREAEKIDGVANASFHSKNVEGKESSVKHLKDVKNHVVKNLKVTYRKIRDAVMRFFSSDKVKKTQQYKEVRNKAKHLVEDLSRDYNQGNLSARLVTDKSRDVLMKLMSGSDNNLMEAAQEHLFPMIDQEVERHPNKNFKNIFRLFREIDAKGMKKEADNEEWNALLNKIQQMPEGGDRLMAIDHFLNVKFLGLAQEDLGQRIKDANQTRKNALPFIEVLSLRIGEDPIDFNRNLLERAIQKLTMDSGSIEKKLGIQKMTEEVVNDIEEESFIIHEGAVCKVMGKEKTGETYRITIKPFYKGGEEQKLNFKENETYTKARMDEYIRGDAEDKRNRLETALKQFAKLGHAAEEHNLGDLANSIQTTLNAIKGHLAEVGSEASP